MKDSKERTRAQMDDTVEDQRKTIHELQTPVIQVWEGILALPIVGTVDAVRAQQMTEALLDRITATGASVVLLDITAVPTVDTAFAKHLIETIAAARLLGTEVMVVGLTTNTALTLVQLGVDLGGVVTRTTMAKGLELAFDRLGLEVIHSASSVDVVRP